MKALLYSSFHLRSLETYQNFLKRRPKNVRTFQFSASTPHQPDIQNKLSQALNLLKPIRKVHLSQFELNQDSFKKSKFFFALKKISKVKILSLSRSQNHKGFIETSLKYFPQIKYLKYQLNGVFRKAVLFSGYSNTHYLSSLKHLRYCSKLENLQLNDSKRRYLFKKTSDKLKKQPKAIAALQMDKVLPKSMRGCSNELISLGFYFYVRDRGRVSDQDLNSLPNLSNIQRLSVWANGYTKRALGVDKALQQIAPPRNLKEVKLSFDLIVELKGILLPLIDCKLTSFSLLADVEHEEDLQSLAEFLKNMSQLKYLDIEIFSKIFDNLSDILDEICKHINNLEALRYLKLAFLGEDTPDKTKLTNFLPCLHHLFTKPIKLETLRFSCNLVNYDQTMQDLLNRLQGLQNSLQSFDLNLENLGTLISRPNQNNNLQKTVDLIRPFHQVKELDFLALPSILMNVWVLLWSWRLN